MSLPLGLAIVGFGGMGHEHARKIQECGVFRLMGCFDPEVSRQELARSLGLIAYDSYASLLSQTAVDVVLIATPNDSHKALSISALEAGKHVICEKPVALSVKELDEILAAQEASGRVFLVHQNRRWDPDYLIVKNLLDQQTLGPVFHIESRVQGSRGIPGDWRKRAQQGGGMMLDWGVHLLDRLVLLLPGKIRSLFCRLHFPTGQEVDEGFHLFLTFETGQTALVEVGTRHFQSLPLWYVLGTEGTAIIADWALGGEVVVRTDGEGDAKPILAGAGLTKTMAPRSVDGELRLPLPGVVSDVTDFYRNAALVMTGQGEALVKNSEVSRIMRLMEAAFESHRLGQSVEFER